MHNHEHDGEEGDDTPQSRQAGPAFCPVVPGNQAMEFEEFGESDERRDVFGGLGQGEGVDYLRRGKSSIKTGDIFIPKFCILILLLALLIYLSKKL